MRLKTRVGHLGNILYQGNNQFALIDLTRVKFSSQPLSLSKRYRNLKHFLSTYEDQGALQQYGTEKLISNYLHCCSISKFKQFLLHQLLMRLAND